MTSGKARLAAVIALTLISAAVHLSALSGWWFSDDPQILVQAYRQSPREYFFVPQAWRYLSSSNFTPLVTLSFEADLSVAGLQPRAFYVHQVIALTAASVLLFLLLAPYAGEIPALFGAVTFLVSPQAILAARMLTVRHYVEGLALALTALLLWRAGRRSGSAGLLMTLISAIAYFLAMLGKEVYIPIPILMLVESALAHERWRRTLMRAVPLGIAFAIYAWWRLHMLGSFGGYQPLDLSTIDPIFPLTLWTVGLGGSPTWVVATTAVGFVTLLVLALKQRRAATLLVLVAALAVVVPPVIAVAAQLDVRHGFFLFAVVAGGMAPALAAAGPKRKVPSIVATSFLLAVLAGGQLVRIEHERSSRHIAVEGKYIWSGPADGSPLLADSSGWYLGGLAELRSSQGRGSGPSYLLSDDALAVEKIDPRTVVRATETALAPLEVVLLRSIDQERARYDPHIPLQVRMERHGNSLQWQFGPEPTHMWTFLTYPKYDEYVVPSSGTITIPEAGETQFFRVRRHLWEGRWTVSPPLAIPDSGRAVTWRSEPATSDLRTREAGVE